MPNIPPTKVIIVSDFLFGEGEELVERERDVVVDADDDDLVDLLAGGSRAVRMVGPAGTSAGIPPNAYSDSGDVELGEPAVGPHVVDQSRPVRLVEGRVARPGSRRWRSRLDGRRDVLGSACRPRRLDRRHRSRRVLARRTPARPPTSAITEAPPVHPLPVSQRRGWPSSAVPGRRQCRSVALWSPTLPPTRRSPASPRQRQQGAAWGVWT